MKQIFLLLMALSLAACSEPSKTDEADPRTPQEAFFASLRELCGQAFSGKLVSEDEVDADFSDAEMVMHVRTCSDTQIRIPFHVDEDHSRTWVISRRRDGGLRLKHDHRHEDGSEDAVTQYGGDTQEAGRAVRQSFPVDAFSIALFEREGLSASVTNVWSVEVDEHKFAYELTRPGRFFRVEFDLTTPVATPAPPWGKE